MHRIFRLFTLFALLSGLAGGTWGAEKSLRVGVLDSSPGMAFRDANGELTGFSIGIIRALCEEMRVQCSLQVTTIDTVIEDTAAGEFDIAAVSLLETPERRARVIFAKPYFRSISLWFARPGVQPGAPGIRVAVVRASAQDRFARAKAWETVGVRTNSELDEPLQAGLAQAAIIPMATALGMMKKEEFRRLGLVGTVMNEPELGGDASFAISPRRPELKEQMDAALERIRRNGTYDRINSLFLPFRVN